MASSNAPYDAQASTNYKEAFALFDKRGNQRVQTDSLGDLLRACGQNPTLQEIRELEKNVGSDCTSLPSHVNFYQQVSRKEGRRVSREERRRE
jgi:Ca2+-binding EF-hand superfamily protein